MYNNKFTLSTIDDVKYTYLFADAQPKYIGETQIKAQCVSFCLNSLGQLKNYYYFFLNNKMVNQDHLSKIYMAPR